MPITTRPEDADQYGDEDHWTHVMELLFVPAIEAAGFEAVRPVSKGSSMIHADIVQNLEKSDMVLCDLSAANPNVFFELGVRTSLDRPMALVKDEQTSIPFDLRGVNVHTYQSSIPVWDIEVERQRLTEHILDADQTCGGGNPLWRQFGLTMRAQEVDPSESPTDAALTLLAAQVDKLTQLVVLGERREKSTMTLNDVVDLVDAYGAGNNREWSVRTAEDAVRVISRGAIPIQDRAVFQQWEKDFGHPITVARLIKRRPSGKTDG